MLNSKTVELAMRLHRNFLKKNQNTLHKGDWTDFYEVAAKFLGI
jgi:hypothetical protein